MIKNKVRNSGGVETKTRRIGTQGFEESYVILSVTANINVGTESETETRALILKSLFYFVILLFVFAWGKVGYT